MIPSTPTEDVDTYIYEVRSVKTDGGDMTETTDDTVTRSESSQIDVVGPQTLTARIHVQPPGKRWLTRLPGLQEILTDGEGP